MYNNSFFKKILIVTSVLFLYSCDKDYNSIGDSLLGGNHFDLNKERYNVLAYNQKIGPVESSNLAVNALGIYTNPAFGTTTANFVTQLTLESLNPTIGNNVEMESVILTVPYFSTLKSTDVNGNHVYELDSIYGSDAAKIKLSVYRSGYYMRDLDPNGGFQQSQKYFTNQMSDFENIKVGSRLNNDVNVVQNDEFSFSSSEYKVTVTTDGKDVVTRTPPGMRLNLDMAYFKTAIIDAVGSGKLATNEVFKEYFRGLYFKVEKSGTNPTALAMLDFRAGKITINYKESDVDATKPKISKAIVLNLSGNIAAGLTCNTVSLLEQSDNKTAYIDATNPVNVNTTLGDAKLYLKGGEGSMAVIELFDQATDVLTYTKSTGLITNGGNGVADELDVIRKNGWLINEANLVFHVDESNSVSDKIGYHPKRIYLYDLNNNLPILDYSDNTTGKDAKSGKLIYDGILNTTVVNDKTYRVRITNQIRNLVKNESAINVKLGLVVTEDINIFTSNKLKTTTGAISQVPKASVMSPLGTIIYGGKATVEDNKRLKLEIYYTKSN